MSYKILLVHPNLTIRKGFDLQCKKTPTIGLLYLAGALIEAGFDVKIFDMMLGPDQCRDFRETHVCYGKTDEQLIEQIKEYRPHLIGMGGFTVQHARIKDLTALIKSFDPTIHVVHGGIHASALPRYVLETTQADFVIQGEGEAGIVALAKALQSGDLEAAHRIDGIGYRDNGQVFVKPKLVFESKLDTIPWPPRHLLENQEYIDDGVPMPIITSRSCPGRCDFCSVHVTAGGKWRSRSTMDVVDEIENIVSLGYKNVAIFDDAANVLAHRLIEICQETLRRKLDVRLTFPGGLIIQYITRELLYWMRKAGAISLSLPVEHVNDNMRNNIIKKKLKMEKIQEVLTWCRELRILALVNFVIGMPGETEETLQEIVDFVKTNAHRFDAVSVYVATPFPGTHFYTECLKQGWLVNPDRNEFIDYDVYTPHLNTGSLSQDTVTHYRKLIEQTFFENRGANFPAQYLRQAIRKPDEESTRYIEGTYFAELGY